ncbi:MAG TPA: rhodanese-like domain-containing protein [Gemmatimonadaceae bacterium]|nr:rhodanese-like domain-containing protein [Gemmatimonadaceae bacterium]
MSDLFATRSVIRLLAGLALLLGVFAAFAGDPDKAVNRGVDVRQLAATVTSEDDHVTAVELAGWIKERRPNLRVIDVRDSSEFDAYHIPTAERLDLTHLVDAHFGSNETVVLYSEGGAHAAQGWVFLRALGHQHVYFLRGGLREWLDEVMNPVVREGTTESARAEFTKVAALSRYFGGVPRAIGSSDAGPSTSAAKPALQSNIADEVRRMRRRGC